MKLFVLTLLVFGSFSSFAVDSKEKTVIGEDRASVHDGVQCQSEMNKSQTLKSIQEADDAAKALNG